MRGLNEWLERDVHDRQSEIRAVAARVDQLRDHLLRVLSGQGQGSSCYTLGLPSWLIPKLLVQVPQPPPVAPDFPQPIIPPPPPGTFHPEPVVIPPVMPVPEYVQPPVIPPQPTPFPPGFVPQGPVIPEMPTGFPPRAPTPSPDFSPVIPGRVYSDEGRRIPGREYSDDGRHVPVVPEQSGYQDEPRDRPPRRARPAPEYVDDEPVVPERPQRPLSHSSSGDLSYIEPDDRGRYSPEDDDRHIPMIPPPERRYAEPIPPTLVRLPTSRPSSTRTPPEHEHTIEVLPPSPPFAMIRPPDIIPAGPPGAVPAQVPLQPSQPMAPIVISASPQPPGPSAPGQPVIVQIPSTGMPGMHGVPVPGVFPEPMFPPPQQQPTTIIVQSQDRSPTPSHRSERSRSESPQSSRSRRTRGHSRSGSRTPPRTEVIQIPSSIRRTPPPPVIVQQPGQPGFIQQPLQTIPGQPPIFPIAPSVGLPVPPPGAPVFERPRSRPYSRSRRSHSRSRSRSRSPRPRSRSRHSHSPSPIIIHTQPSEGPRRHDPRRSPRSTHYPEEDPGRGRPVVARTETRHTHSPPFVVRGDSGGRHTPVLVRTRTGRSHSRTPPHIIVPPHTSSSHRGPVIVTHRTQSRSRSRSPIRHYEGSRRPHSRSSSPRLVHVRPSRHSGSRSPRLVHVRSSRHSGSRSPRPVHVRPSRHSRSPPHRTPTHHRSRSPTYVHESHHGSRPRSPRIAHDRPYSSRSHSPSRRPHTVAVRPSTRHSRSRSPRLLASSRPSTGRHRQRSRSPYEDPGSHHLHRSPPHVPIIRTTTRRTARSPSSEHDQGSPSATHRLPRSPPRGTRSGR